MVSNPFGKLDFFEDKYFNRLSFRIEACKNPVQTLAKIKSMSRECGIAINAATHENSIYYLYEFVDYILVMAVEGGFIGQDFNESAIEKTKNIRGELNKRKMYKDIYIDGHIDKETTLKLCKAGANAFVGGSSGLFRNGHILKDNLEILRNNLIS